MLNTIIKIGLKIPLISAIIILIASCNVLDYLKGEEKPKELCIIGIDSKTTGNNLILPGTSLLNLEIYFIRNSYLIEDNKEPLTNILKSLNISELSSYVALSRNSYEIIPNKKIRDSIELDKKSQKALLLLRHEDKILSHKILNIYPKKTNTIHIELIDKVIKVLKVN
jgi:hypothetical protein